jgi:pimeloyl-ACP methyl ester carboxylesterase
MTTVVLLRGLTRERAHWGAFPDVLRRAMPDAHVVAADLPGSGTRVAERSPTSIEATADAVREAVLASGLRPPFAIVAMSLGAMVALAWSARYAAEIEACVLVSASARPHGAFWRRLRPRSYPVLLGIALGLYGSTRRESAIHRLTSALDRSPASTIGSWVRIHEERGVRRGNALRQLAAAARFSALPPDPRTRVLLLAGARDRIVDPSCSERLARAWNVPLALHPCAGHDVPLDDPGWVAERVREWLGPAMPAPDA